ncbi:MAG: type II toxin-antitoxin system VapC family toxin [Solirubrobacterales bacterium]
MFLVDASVWVAAVTPQHPQHVQAEQFLRVGPPLMVLDLTLYEVANVIARKYGEPDVARRLVQGLFRGSASPPLQADVSLFEDGLDLMSEHRLTAYDAAYVAAARRNGWQLVSLDVRDLVSRGLAVTPDAAVYP